MSETLESLDEHISMIVNHIDMLNEMIEYEYGMLRTLNERWHIAYLAKLSIELGFEITKDTKFPCTKEMYEYARANRPTFFDGTDPILEKVTEMPTFSEGELLEFNDVNDGKLELASGGCWIGFPPDMVKRSLDLQTTSA